MRKRRIMITGTGAVSAAGIGTEAMWQSVLQGTVNQQSRTYRLGDGGVVSYPVYAMPELDLRDLVSASDYGWLEEEGLTKDPDFVLLAYAASLALEQAGLREEDRLQTALVIGHENLGVNALIDRILTSPAYAARRSPMAGSSPWQDYEDYSASFYRLQTFPYLFYIAKLLGIRGISFTVNNACATGLYALELGAQLIRGGSAERVLVVCSDYAHVTEHAWLQQKGFSSAAQRLRPFDADRDGSLLGDGAAAVVIEASAVASARLVKPWAVYCGASLKQDNWHMSLPDYPSHTYSDVMRRASTLGSRKPIELLIPHGTGNQLWDRYEMEEIARAFPKQPLVTAFKGSIGHTLGANALLETILILHCMRDGLVPPIVNCSRPDVRMPFPVAAAMKELPVSRAMKAVPAYGGFQAASVFESVPEGGRRYAGTVEL